MPQVIVCFVDTRMFALSLEEVEAMSVSEINKDTSVAEIVKRYHNARRIFDPHALKGCGGEHGLSEP